jgi:hypothetical protein
VAEVVLAAEYLEGLESAVRVVDWLVRTAKRQPGFLEIQLFH